MTIKNLPSICGIDKVKIYKDNVVLIEQWVSGASLHWYFDEVETLKQFKDCEVDYLEMCPEEYEIVVCEIYLK